MHYDVVAIGEPIIDFVPLPDSASGNLVYEAFTGGGACNVLAQVAAYGGQSAIIGAVGSDVFGQFVTDKLNEAGVYTPGLHHTTVKNTGIGFVHLGDSGERSFTFYRNPEAQVDLFLPEDEAVLAGAKIFHFTSVSLSGQSIRQSTVAAIECARRNNVAVSFDVNLRAALWKNGGDDAKEQILRCIAMAAMVKLSEEEKVFLYGNISNTECAARLHDQGVALAAISMGSAGSFFSYPRGEEVVPSFKIAMVDSTGCGDAFAGTLLAQLAAYPLDRIEDIPQAEMKSLFSRANAAGAICGSRYGSFSIMPTKKEILAL